MVGNLQTKDLADLADRHEDHLVFPAVFDRVAGEIRNDLFDFILIRVDESLLWRVEDKIIAFALLQNFVRSQNRSGGRG